MTKLQQVKEIELAMGYAKEKEFLNECFEAIKKDYNYSDILAQSILEKAYLPVHTTLEFFTLLDDYCNNIKLVIEG